MTGTVKSKYSMVSNLIKVGTIVGKVVSDIEILHKDVSLWLMIHNLNENLESKNTVQNGKNYAKKLLLEIEPKIKMINEEIKALNKISTLFELDYKIKIIKIDGLKKVINGRFKVSAKDKDLGTVLDENFHMKMSSYFLDTRKEVYEFIAAMGDNKMLVIKKVKSPYRTQLMNAVDIMCLGIFDGAVFTAGRAVEDVINNLLRELIKKHRIPSIDLKRKSLYDKVKLLNDNKIITDKLFHDLHSTRISRNDAGHPTKIKFSRQDALDAINQSVSLIRRVELITNRVKG